MTQGGGGGPQMYIIDSCKPPTTPPPQSHSPPVSEADDGNEKKDRFGDRHDAQKESKPSRPPLPSTPQGKKKFLFSKEASQSFAVEQISEHTNRIASRKLMFSQKTSGVVVTTWSALQADDLSHP